MTRCDRQKKIPRCGCVASLALVVVMLMAPGRSLAATIRTWDGGGANANASTKANWSDDIAPVAGDAIVLNATTNKNMTWDLNIELGSWTQVGYTGTVTMATVYGTNGFTNLVITGDCIISNGVWTQMANPAVDYEVNRLRASIGGNLVVGPDATIDVIGKGYTRGFGPGSSTVNHMGGSYGGCGNGTSSGPCYGSIVSPTNLGSAGNTSWGGPGGGAICFDVVGNARVDGLVCANGSYIQYDSGAGGSIWLTAAALFGTGTVQAVGGTCTRGAGGGGRIALMVTNAGYGFGGTVSAYGGIRNAMAGGGAGTIYIEQPGDANGHGHLIVDQGGIVDVGRRTVLSGVETVTYEFSRVTLSNAAALVIGPGNTLIATNTVLTVALADNKIVLNGGTLLVPDVFAFSNLLIHIDTDSAFAPATSITVGAGATLSVDTPYVCDGDLIVASGGAMTHSANADAETYKLDLTVRGNLFVWSGGSVDVTGKGYAKGQGFGSCAVNGAGGSHGGRGCSASSGPCYGSIAAPYRLGSGGNSGNGGPGGGVIRLAVSGVASNGGLICADGGAIQWDSGAGGSIHLTAGALIGAGVIRADGGTCGRGVGGGGRVAVTVTNAGADFSEYGGTFSAASLSGGASKGGAGTVYLRTGTQGEGQGTLVVGNNGLSNTYRTDINSNVTDTEVGDVIIRDAAQLLLDVDQTLTVSGIWSNAASFAGLTDSVVFLGGDSGSTSTVYGSTTFMGLFCTNGLGKTIRFEAGQTTAVDALGRLKLNGAESMTNLVLRSTADGIPWALNLAASVDQTVSSVDVADSDALEGVGTPVTALNSIDRGGNSNWVFVIVGVGETNVWTGGNSTVWSSADNWSLVRAPIPQDVVKIPTLMPRYPVLDDNRTVSSLDIETGASLDLVGYNLAVTANAIVAGTLSTVGTETLTLNGDVDFTGGTFVPARSTVVITGDGPQSVRLGGQTFHKIVVLNDADTVAFGDDFLATELRCEAPVGTRRLTFQPGATVTLRDLVLLGSAATTNITLRSSASGQKWNLVVSGYRSVRGVDVQDSDADGGLPITATASKDSLNNDNWVFDTSWSTWQGTSGSDFHTAANWSPEGVPGAHSRVRVDTANPMVVTGAVTLLDLTVGGGGVAATGTFQAVLTVVENITVLNNGTLVIDSPCTVSNGLYVLGGGLLTHDGPQTSEASTLAIVVHGNTSVDVGGTVDVIAKGYEAAFGPGSPGIYGDYGGGSYGGRATHSSGRPGPCYGSIIAPINLGSGGGRSAGGGAVRMQVSGELRIDGSIYADGGPYLYYTGSGGSIFLTAATLSGIGPMRANGGPSTGGYTSPGAGGRIALVVTAPGADFSDYTGMIEAFSSRVGSSAYNAGAGTIYKEREDDRPGYGTVMVSNDDLSSTGNTDMSPAPGYPLGEAARASFHVSDAGMLRLTNDFTVGDIWLDTANARLDLGGYTLTVNAREHELGLGNVVNEGEIIWTGLPPGVLIIVK